MKLFETGILFTILALSEISEAFTTWGSVSNPRRVYVASSRKSGTGVKVPDSFDKERDRSASRYLPEIASIKTTTLLLAKGGKAVEPDGRTGSVGETKSSISGIGSFGSNVLVVVSVALVIKGLLLPEDVRHLSFCPSEDPIRGRDTIPWRMMEESGRECGTIPEVMSKYVTAPLVFPGTSEWGMMLNAKEDAAKNAWLME